MININEGNRPSRLSLDRYIADELSDDQRTSITAYLAENADGRHHIEAIEAARGIYNQRGNFDCASLRARATTLTDEVPVLPEAANRPNWAWLAPVLMIAAVLLGGFLTTLQPKPSVHTTIRSSDALQIFQLQDDQLHPYEEGTSLGDGDVLGFKVGTAGHDAVVILSVDGNGAVSVFYPESGDQPVPLTSNGMMALPGSVILDNAPGPEIFFAVFDTPVSKARDEAARAWQAGGMEGLQDWVNNDADVAGVAVERE